MKFKRFENEIIAAVSAFPQVSGAMTTVIDTLSPGPRVTG